MASLNLFFSPIVTPQRRVVRSAATASKGSGGSASEEKGILDFILGGLAKQEQIYETDPILKKVEEKNGGTTTTARKNSAAPPPPAKKKDGGFGLGGLFAKK
ncbi:hypothetical protein PHJA_000376300 [Phtheirospermum japonicum]|uniref:Thylakoid soluble phosphoprotein TSP9 n=1 Tax=Phtheirospermum japonicum TaxID=374723 RepID=A0A830BJS0_9LAMI|nr:hypothetical protein PHJA_000376300 [Phtheirospermum japonicum]